MKPAAYWKCFLVLMTLRWKKKLLGYCLGKRCHLCERGKKQQINPNFSWDDFLKKLDKGKRRTTEAMLSGCNPSYKKSMTATTTLAVKKTIATDKVLEHIFNFLLSVHHTL